MTANMKYWSGFSFSFLVLNHNVTIVGKSWLIYTMLMKLILILFGAYPLYQDELVAFVCNTNQPGCPSVCYDAFTAVSQVRFWLLECLSVLLPFAVYVMCILHSVGKQVVEAYSLPCTYCKQIKASIGFRDTDTASSEPTKNKDTCGAHELAIPDFSRAYAVQLLLRIMIEIGFSISSYNLFGFFVDKLYNCSEDICPSDITCFVPRTTEKSAMMILLWIVGIFSICLGLLDLIIVIKECRNKLITSKSKIGGTRLNQRAGGSRDLFNFDDNEDGTSFPMKRFRKERHCAKEFEF
ncbi:gap junction delta-4 protein-like [Pseudonaja textilis]|uniref:gap junction delta-4 protein-like n=1 Tax=Pseudonaja textilis TaxID=8673 RepID=UPI000EAA8040|nr:gap junction delta-4 protein-like [Pseudonaja textilis]